MSRQPSLRGVQRNAELLHRIQTLKAEHPFWGYRRLWAYLRVVEQLPVNKKRILRLLREHHLLVTPHQRLKAKRTPTRSKPKPTRPNEWWGIDMTEVLVEQPWLIKHPRSSNEIMTTATGLHSLPLDSRGALHAASSAMRNAVRQ
jgi:HTH-like domain